MPISAHRQKLIQQYPSLINGDPNFRTSGNAHLGKRIICRRPKHLNIAGLTAGRRKSSVKGTIIGYLSESDVDKLGNAAFVATKTSQYSREGEPARLFHIALDEKDKDNDAIVVDLEEWEIDDYCEWIAVDEEGGQNDGQGQVTQGSSTTRDARPKNNDKQGTKTTEFERLNNLALEAAASVSNVPAVVETSIYNANDGMATLEEAAAAGCNKCRKLLETGKKSFGPHVKHCPRNGLKKSDEKLGKGSNGVKSSVYTDSQASNNTIDASRSRKSAGVVGESRKRDKSSDNTQIQSIMKTMDTSDSGEKLGNNFAIEAAASVSNVPAVAEKSIYNANDGMATLEEAAAAGCNKCRKLLETGKKSFGPHVKHCPRNGLKKSDEKLGKGSNGVKSSVYTDSQASNNTIDASRSRKSAGVVGESRKRDKSSDNTQIQSSMKTMDTSDSGEKLGNNFAIEAAASVSNVPAVVETSIYNANDGMATLEEAAAAGCNKCRKLLETGKKSFGPHVKHCPRNGLRKSDEKLGKGSNGVKSSVYTDSQASNNTIDASRSRKSAGVVGESRKSDKSSDNTQIQSSMKTMDTSDSGEKLGNNFAIEAAASVSNVPAVVETSINNANDGMATLEEAAAAGCNKCRKLLETGKKSFGPHVKHCPRNGLRKSEEKTIDQSGSGRKVGSNDKRSRSTKNEDNADIESSKKTIDSSGIGGKTLGNSDKCDKGVGSSRGNAGIQSSKKKKMKDSSRRDHICENLEKRTHEDHARALSSKPVPSFNDILKSALASYSSNTRKKNTNDPPPPVPPPFLSHEENCTIRTALAFVMAKAKNKEKNKEKNSDAQTMQTNGSSRNGPSPLVGGLLALPPQKCAPIGQMNLNVSSVKIVLDREMKHVRDVMNLAVSALLPLYKSSTLILTPEQNFVDRQRQCAVYDYESAAKQSQFRGSQLPSSERHLASLDGLCRHIIGRLSSILNDKALRHKLTNESSAVMPKDTSNDDQIDFSVNADDYVSQEEADKDVVRDAVAQLQMDFIIDSLRHSSNPVQQTHQILASCHVLHRLLLLDENCTSIGSDCVAMACTLLTDLYNDKCIGGTNGGCPCFEEQDDKEKHQVVPSRWSYTTSSYIANREERRMQAVHTLSRHCYSNGPAITGMKRSAKQSQDESSDNQAMQLPRLGDVLAVNLLRLLEGASAIRLHFHRRYEGRNNGFVTRKVATSAAAAEVLQEIRSKTDDNLLLPIHINDAASVYYHETLKRQERRAGKVDHLRPGAKMMLRIHLFGLIQKLSLYEQG